MENDRKQTYVESLRRMVRIATVSDPAHRDPETFVQFHALLRELFPKLFELCTVQEFDGSLLLKWAGAPDRKEGGAERLPVLFMNHHDVVPAGTDGWEYPPFSAELVDGKIWGRGTLDDKSGLFAMMQAAEELAAEGFTPERDIYFETGCNEETTSAGADAITAWMKEQGIRLEMVFDEGGYVVHDPIGGADGTFAMIGVGEKSIVDIRFTARSTGGHASTPGKDTPLVRLGKFMAYLERHQIFDVQLSPTVAEMLKQFAPYMGKAGKVVGKADRLRYPLKKVLPLFGPTAASLLSTTIAFTMAGGGDAVNVIPHEAWVIGDMRCSHHQGRDKSIAAVMKAAKKFGLEAEVIDLGVESHMADHNGKAFRFAAEAAMKTVPGVDACAPYIMTGASDARYFDRVCDQCIRFLPFTITTEQMASIHGVNECIDVDTLVPAVDYYRYLLQHV